MSNSFGHDNWNLVFSVTLWYLWLWRNRKVFSNIDYPLNGRAFIQPYVQDICRAIGSSESGSPLKKGETMIGWKKPGEGYVKLNTDGCNRHNSTQASTGGLLQDENGRWLSGFTANMGHSDSLMAETWVAIYGLEMAWSAGHRRVILKMDSKVLAAMITSQRHQRRFFPMLHKIEELLNRDWEVIIRHVFR